MLQFIFCVKLYYPQCYQTYMSWSGNYAQLTTAHLRAPGIPNSEGTNRCHRMLVISLLRSISTNNSYFPGMIDIVFPGTRVMLISVY